MFLLNVSCDEEDDDDKDGGGGGDDDSMWVHVRTLKLFDVKKLSLMTSVSGKAVN